MHVDCHSKNHLQTPMFGVKVMFLLACFLLAWSLSAFAQQATGDIVGNVTDATGAALPGAAVTVRNTGTGETRTATSGNSGQYEFRLLQVGSYTVSVRTAGFKTFDATSVQLPAGSRIRVDANMLPGAVTESVEVTSTPPTLQTDSSSVGSTVNQQQVQDLPLNGRNYVDLVQNQAGVNSGPATSMSSGTRPDDRRQSSSFSANGQPETQNAQYLDGLDNVDRQQGGLGIRPSIDAIAEVQVQTNLFTAESGRTAGAVVNVITKSGTNSIHGSVYEFLRNDIFDARDYFARTGVVSKPRYRQNQFGASLGGPIVSNKTFYFADIEDLRTIQGENPVLSSVPTLYEEQHPGDFTDVGGGKIAGPISPIGLAYFKMFPAPNLSGSSSNFLYGGVKTQKSLTGDVRVDHHFNANNTFFVRYSGNPVTTFTPGILPPTTVNGVKVNPGGGSAINTSVSFPGNAQEDGQSLAFNYTHIFTPNLLMELKAGYTYIKIFSLPLNAGTNISSALGIPNTNTDQFSTGLTLFSPAGYNQPGNTIFDGLGDAQFIPILNTNHTYQYLGAITYQIGKHGLKMGAGVIRRHLNDLQQIAPEGIFAFFGGPAGASTVSSAGVATNSLAQMLTDTPNFLFRVNSLFKPHYQFWEPSGYIQDDWHILPKLTLNLGLRYEVFTQFDEEKNRFANFDLASFSIIQATSSNRHPGINNDYRDVSPRFGFAATIAPKTVVRGGYGISYTPGIQPGFNNTPFASSFSCVPGAPVASGGCNSTYGTFEQGFPAPVAGSPNSLSGTVVARQADTRTPYVQMWNLLAQKEIGANTFSVGYSGQRGHRFTIDPNIDLPTPSTGAQRALVYSAQLPNVTNVTYRVYEGHTAYDVSFQRAFRAGFTFNANYTLAHGLANIDTPGQPNTFRLLLPSNLNYDYGNTDNDIRNRFAVLAAYELPFGKNTHGLRAIGTKGWQINGVSVAQSGQAYTVTDASAIGQNRINVPTVTADRPNQTRNARLGGTNINHFFDTSAFSLQALGTPGNEAVNQLYGPHFVKTDVSAFKSFDITERLKLQFRAEIFNAFNHPYFNLPNSAISSYNGSGPLVNGVATVQTGDAASTAAGFGSITSTSPNSIPRQVQFALRLSY